MPTPRLIVSHGSPVGDSVKTSKKRLPGRPIRAAADGSLRTRPAVVAPTAGARTAEQLAELLPLASLRLTDDEVKKLDEASA